MGYHVGFDREAVEHFLTALNLQQQSKGPKGESSQMSENIWSTMRMAVSLMGQPDLHKACDARDIQMLNQHFKIDTWPCCLRTLVNSTVMNGNNSTHSANDTLPGVLQLIFQWQIVRRLDLNEETASGWGRRLKRLGETTSFWREGQNWPPVEPQWRVFEMYGDSFKCVLATTTRPYLCLWVKFYVWVLPRLCGLLGKFGSEPECIRQNRIEIYCGWDDKPSSNAAIMFENCETNPPTVILWL